ncbi:MAG: aldose epimerase family protein [Proteocatella sp.]
MIKTSKKTFGKLRDGREATIYSMSRNNFTVKISDYGASIVSISFDDSKSMADEEALDIVLGFDSALEYENDNCCFGAVCGRFANRIKDGKFTLNGNEYKLAVNNNTNHLHGGVSGFNRKLWQAEFIPDGISLSYTSPDGEEGYPGNLDVKVLYTIIQDNTLDIHYIAKSDKDTLVNLTNHSYFNLCGHDKGKVLNHSLKIDANNFTELDESSCPSGKISPVKDTPLDFEDFHTLGERIASNHSQLLIGNGYDHNFVLNNDSSVESLRGIKLAATAICHSSQNTLEMKVYTNKPGVQLYTANYMEENTKGKNGACYGAHSGFCLETQYFPDGINHDNFPSPVLKAGEEYNFTTIYSFSRL